MSKDEPKPEPKPEPKKTVIKLSNSKGSTRRPR